MKFLYVLLLGAILSGTAQAAPMTCEDLQNEYKKDSISEFAFSCKGKKSCKNLKLKQLRAAATLILQEPRPDLSDSALVKYFKPTYTKVTIAGESFDGVRAMLLEQPFITYFNENTDSIQKFLVDAGSIKAGGEECYDIEFGPFLSEVRKSKACEQIVAKVNEKVPNANLDVSDCTFEYNDFFIAATSLTKAKLNIAGKVDNFTSYKCSVDIERSTDAVSNLKCKIDE